MFRRMSLLVIVLVLLSAKLPVRAGDDPAAKAPPVAIEILSDHEVRLSWQPRPIPMYLEKRTADEFYFVPLDMVEPGQGEFTDSSLKTRVTYEYRLRPAEVEYLDMFGDPSQVRIVIPPPPPPIISRVGVDSVKVLVPPENEWSGSVAVEQRIEGIFQRVGEIQEGAFLGVGGLETGKYQYFRLRNMGEINRSDPSSTDSIPLPFPPPTNLAVETVDDHSVSLSWKPSIEGFPCGYEVQKTTLSDSSIHKVKNGVTSWTDEEVAYDLLTYYRVRGAKGDNRSDFTPAVSVRIRLQPVRDFTMDNVADLVTHLSWRNSGEIAVKYIVERSINDGPFQQIAELPVTQLAFTDSLARRGVKTAYRITSATGEGMFVTSNILRQTVPLVEAGMTLVNGRGDCPDFFMDRTEVTVERYLEFCRESGRNQPPDPAMNGYSYYWTRFPGFPAVMVSWDDAVAFCNWRSERVGLEPAYDDARRLLPDAAGYRLPDSLRFIVALKQAGPDSAFFFAMERAVTPNDQPAPVNLLEQNMPGNGDGPFYLIGNVWEWLDNRRGPDGRLTAGGGFTTPFSLAGFPPFYITGRDRRSPTLGFRCVVPAAAVRDNSAGEKGQ